MLRKWTTKTFILGDKEGLALQSQNANDDAAPSDVELARISRGAKNASFSPTKPSGRNIALNNRVSQHYLEYPYNLT